MDCNRNIPSFFHRIPGMISVLNYGNTTNASAKLLRIALQVWKIFVTFELADNGLREVRLRYMKVWAVIWLQVQFPQICKPKATIFGFRAYFIVGSFKATYLTWELSFLFIIILFSFIKNWRHHNIVYSSPITDMIYDIFLSIWKHVQVADIGELARMRRIRRYIHIWNCHSLLLP